MKKILFSVLFIALFSTVAFAEDMLQVMPKQKKRSVYLMGNIGVLVPSDSLYDTTFSGGGLLGFQITDYFAMEAGATYQKWSLNRLGVPFSANVVDFKLYFLYQQDFRITENVSIIPNFGIAPIFSYHQADSVYNSFGIAGKLGVRATYSYFIAGVSVEYTIKDQSRNAVSVMFEAGARLKF